MSIITKISQQKDKNRANIYLDGEFAFGISLEELLKRGLNVGKEIGSEQLKEIKAKDAEERVYGNAINFVTMRARSEKEIKLWFKRKKIDTNTETEIFNRLKSINLVDDKKFAAWWVEQRLTFRPKSRRALRMELKQKGVSEEIIDEALKDPDLTSEKETAKDLLSKNTKKFARYPEKERKKKMIGFLGRRGFSWEIIKKAIEIDE